ncbi:hexose kinase [Schleiferilactobacillus perolens]|uniref:Tagatose-6-phosphate kinase n=1 Tax=Schleiferilactobacillus perolens DSM 12744 TaxID=1423792 RepID=A0A0R1N7B6_9LACO|nr:hexose kinase [Schleiferilactobacillus perolens]KRL13749.1 tagatose-6-phosphate kinase [Schleiferilactobacillus perolens DSM 12744]
MILTVTMNPSIDMAYALDHLKIDDVNRVSDVRKTAGGKGLNVTRVIHLMSQPVKATGVLGGNFGKFIEDQLDNDSIQHSFTHINQETRNSIAILHDGGKQTELLEAGPTLSGADAQAFQDHFDALLDETNLVTMSGSLPGGLAPSFYSELVAHAAQKGIKVLLDTSGASLAAAVKSEHKPFLIKPNDEELGNLLGEKVDRTDLPKLQQQLQDPRFDGIDWVVVSLGSKGAFAKHGNKFYQAAIPKINAVNPVGSGDSTIAGLAMALAQDKDDATVLKTAMTCGLLNTLEATTGFVNPDHFDEYFNQVTVIEK